MSNSIYKGFEDYFNKIDGLNSKKLNETLRVTIKVNKDDPGIKKRGFFSTPETDKPPIISSENIKIEGMSYDNKDFLIVKGIEYYLLAMYAQWKSQYNHRKYSDLVGYLGDTYTITQNNTSLNIHPEIINSSLRNTLLSNLFIHLEETISNNFDVNKPSKWWTFLQKTRQYSNQILSDIDQRDSITTPTFSFVNSIYKINLPL